MKNAILILVALFCGPVLRAQENRIPGSQSQHIDCSKENFRTPACDSFNEMLENSDPDIADAVSGSQQAFVCFRKDSDVFLLISYYEPSSWLHGDNQRAGTLTYTRYRDGVLNDVRTCVGDWKKLPSGDARFRGQQCFIDSAELIVEYSDQNLNNETTHYSVQIRRSTLRFVENFHGTERKTGQPPKGAKSNSQFQLSETGYCEKFPREVIDLLPKNP